MRIDPRVPSYLGRVLDNDGRPAGTCFQVLPGVLVTACHVLDTLGAGGKGATVAVDPLQGGAVRYVRVERADPDHDLAVLVTGEPLPDCVARPGRQRQSANNRASVIITGVPVLDDPGHSYQFLDAEGHWAGGTTRDEGPARPGDRQRGDERYERRSCADRPADARRAGSDRGGFGPLQQRRWVGAGLGLGSPYRGSGTAACRARRYHDVGAARAVRAPATTSACPACGGSGPHGPGGGHAEVVARRARAAGRAHRRPGVRQERACAAGRRSR